MKRFAILIVCLILIAGESTAKPVTTVSNKPAVDYSELDKLVPAELKEKNTPAR